MNEIEISAILHGIGEYLRKRGFHIRVDHAIKVYRTNARTRTKSERDADLVCAIIYNYRQELFAISYGRFGDMITARFELANPSLLEQILQHCRRYLAQRTS